jgi:excisionase family DNA binding protein
VTGRLVTARQVADRLGVAPRTVLRWTRRGELPAIRLPGGALRYDEHHLDGWLEERATPRQLYPDFNDRPYPGLAQESAPAPRERPGA